MAEPKSAFDENSLRWRRRCCTSRLSTRQKLTAEPAMAAALRPMSITFHSPMSSALSEIKKHMRGNWMARVRVAWIVFRLTICGFQSPNIPDGRSIDTTVASTSLIYCTNDLNPPLSSSRSPDPNSPSITRWLDVILGMLKLLCTSWNVISGASRSSLSRWAMQSALSLSPPMLKR